MNQVLRICHQRHSSSRIVVDNALALLLAYLMSLCLAAASDMALAKHHRQRKRTLVSHIPASNTTCYIWQPGDHIASLGRPHAPVRLLMFTR